MAKNDSIFDKLTKKQQMSRGQHRRPSKGALRSGKFGKSQLVKDMEKTTKAKFGL